MTSVCDRISCSVSAAQCTKMSHIRTAEVGTPIAGGSDILKINGGSDCYLLNASILEMTVF